jgi:hypothetical protein
LLYEQKLNTSLRLHFISLHHLLILKITGNTSFHIHFVLSIIKWLLNLGENISISCLWTKIE